MNALLKQLNKFKKFKACLSFNLSRRNFSRQALDPGFLQESFRALYNKNYVKKYIYKQILNLL